MIYCKVYLIVNLHLVIPNFNFFKPHCHHYYPAYFADHLHLHLHLAVKHMPILLHLNPPAPHFHR